MTISPIDLAVVGLYLVMMTGFGGWLCRRQSAERFMSAGRGLPGWAVGLSIFGSYVSSISFLANPAKSYAENWSAFAFALPMPLAAWIAVRWFVPFYRRSGEVSAYDHLQRRFGEWARVYVVVCFLALQVTRHGTVMHLLAHALQPFFGGTEPALIVVMAVLMTVYPLLGGQEAVIWAGVFQALVLLSAPLICLAVIGYRLPGGWPQLVEAAAADGKFSLAGLPPNVPLVGMLAFGLTTHLQNFGIDQSYVQRFVTAKSDRAAQRSVWLATCMFMPVSALFFLIGTALFVYSRSIPDWAGATLPARDVFPWFIRYELPVGLRGLVIAALCAAAMDSNFASMATLYWCDIHRKLFSAGDPKGIRVLRWATLSFAALSLLAALGLLHSQQILDTWWMLTGICSGGMLGLFLLGRMCPRVDGRSAAAAVICGTLVILWMTVSASTTWLPPRWRSTLHEHLIMVVGTLTVLGVGALVQQVRGLMRRPPPAADPR